jgi:hypothetical protein
MIFITACLCMLILSFMRAVQTAFAIDSVIKRTQPVLGSVRYYCFASLKSVVDSYVAAATAPDNSKCQLNWIPALFLTSFAARYGCSVFQEQLSPTESALNTFPSASEIDVLQVMFENAPEGYLPPSRSTATAP